MSVTIAVETLLTPEINQPARYLGNELGAAHKPWESATVRWVLTYPEIYEVGFSNLGHIILYNILNAQSQQLSDRAYLPAKDFAQKLRDTQTPLFAVESRRPLVDFDILGFSLSYELGATNILEMLDLAGIPLTWQERKETNFPLIFAGGQTATSNPEPYADFFDFIAMGDGEELLPEIGFIVEDGKAAGLNREELLLDLAQVPGVYVPQFYDMAEDGSVHPNRPNVPKRILRRVATPMPAYSVGPVPHIQTVHDRLVMEIRRGCTRGCRFCQPGMLTRPARDVEPEKVIEAIETGMRQTGYNEFSLLSLSCSDYLSLPAVGMEIKNRLKNENITLSLPSQRVDRFDDNIADILGGNRQGSLTFAPEAGTQRMRDIVNKGLTDEELLRGVKTAYDRGWDKVKLYFMIGLPGETDADILGIAETIHWLQQECSAPGRKRLSVTLTISNFTPKPHTPFQWHSVSTAEFRRKQGLLRQEFRQMRGVKANFTDVRISAMEDFVGRGDRRLSSVLRRAWELGAGMDAWWESLDRAFAAWNQAIDESNLTWKYRQVENGEWNVMNPQFKELRNSIVGTKHLGDNLSGKAPNLAPKASPVQEFSSDKGIQADEEMVPPDPKPLDQPLPWDHLDTGIDKKWLQEDLQRALEEATVPDCSFEGCSHCGVCTPDFGHNIVLPPPPIPVFQGQFTPPTNRVQRLRVWYGKLGDMARVGHLDLAKLFDRAIRRAAIPIAFTGGFHPGPRILPANALSLGATSTGEIVEFELTQEMEPQDFGNQLAAQLPKDIPVYHVESANLQAPTATQLLDKAEYRLTIDTEGEMPHSEQIDTWITTILSQDAIWTEHKTKSGRKKPVNLRERLFALSSIESKTPDTFQLRYIGSCRNDGNLLRPSHVIEMLEQVSQQEFRLLKVHRERLILAHVY
jgi:radical SAM family uncharacterized protein/radical SAM-linked protein